MDKSSHWDLPEILGGPWRSAGVFEPQNSALFKSDCRSSTCMGRDAREMQAVLTCLQTRISTSGPCNLTMTSGPRIKRPARLRGSLPKTHIMTACWGRLSPTLSCGLRTLAKIRGDQIRKPRLCCPAGSATSARQCQLSLCGQIAIPAAMPSFCTLCGLPVCVQ